MHKIDLLPSNVKHKLGVVLKALPDFMIIYRLMFNPVNQSVNESKISFKVSFFLIRDVRDLAYLHLPNVYLTGKIVPLLLLQEHRVCDSRYVTWLLL